MQTIIYKIYKHTIKSTIFLLNKIHKQHKKKSGGGALRLLRGLSDASPEGSLNLLSLSGRERVYLCPRKYVHLHKIREGWEREGWNGLWENQGRKAMRLTFFFLEVGVVWEEGRLDYPSFSFFPALLRYNWHLTLCEVGFFYWRVVNLLYLIIRHTWVSFRCTA